MSCATVLAAGAVAVMAACSDSNVPFFTEPTTVAETPSGIQNAITGVFGQSRADGFYDLSVGFARDGSVFTNTEPRTVLYPLGVQFIPNTSGGVWALEFQNIRQMEEILAAIPGVVPAFSAAQAASVTGIVQTWKAYMYMAMLEAHDTLGVAILATPNQTTLPQAICMKDGWEYVIAILDSANTDLVTAGATPPPVTLPTGFKGVGLASGPGSVTGSFASFNRALTVKALLELAYAIPRNPPAAGAPTDSAPGSPDHPTLARALSLLDSTAMFNASGALLAPPTPGGFTASSSVVTWDFSGVANDVPNPIDQNIGQEAVLNDLVVSVDTAHDLRWKAKFIINTVPVQQQTYNPVATETHFDATIGHDTTYSYLYYMSPTLGSPIPIIRGESMTLIAAQIHLAMADYPGALTLVNQVRTTVGGLTAYPATDATAGNAYVTTRNDLMREQRISLTWESGNDRTIAIRMYGLAAVADTTWGTPGHAGEASGVTTGDLHTTVLPIPSGEINGRGGSFTTTCQ